MTFRDWLQLLLVPVVLTVGGFWFSLQQDSRQQAIEDQRAQDTALQAYLDQMSHLLLDKDLRSAEPFDNASVVARARTLTVLRRLDPVRKGEVVRFLIEAKLVAQERDRALPVISLKDADLSGARLWSVTLSGADLNNADLQGAFLLQAILPDAQLMQANLSNANLRSTNLSGAQLSSANLSNADLRGAWLVAEPSDPLVHGANHPRNADLTGADLSGADLEDARVTKFQLEQARSLEGATMPDGSEHP